MRLPCPTPNSRPDPSAPPPLALRYRQAYYSTCGQDMSPWDTSLYMTDGLHPITAGMARVLTCMQPLVLDLVEQSKAEDKR